ncbi:hypothetical protein EIP86_002685 [Pleurotus ostreatoroseus]|nr:hypothetical protein EIP86_002685 [Pleurotus ostreatoroseus]
MSSMTTPTLQYLNVMQLEVVSRRSAPLRTAVDIELNTRFTRILMNFFENPSRFRQQLAESESVISGSAALNFILGRGGWVAKDLDVYTPHGRFEAVTQYLIDVEGFRDISDEIRRSRRGLTYRRLPMESGIIRVASLQKGTWKVDVVQSRSESALYAIPRFWSTLQMNFISAYGNGDFGSIPAGMKPIVVQVVETGMLTGVAPLSIARLKTSTVIRAYSVCKTCPGTLHLITPRVLLSHVGKPVGSSEVITGRRIGTPHDSGCVVGMV